MTKFMTFNKEQTRVLISRGLSMFTYSGDLGNPYVSSFTPHLNSDNCLIRKLVQLVGGCTYVPYKEKEILSIETGGCSYMWLKLKGDDRVYKIYKKTSWKPSNSSIIYPDGRVMLKGVGNFIWEDFVEVVF